jgi:hypothetical protein
LSYTEVLARHCSIGTAILDRPAAEGWGRRVNDLRADDLPAKFPQMRGISRSNLKHMRRQPRCSQTQLANNLLDNCRRDPSRLLLDRPDKHAEPCDQLSLTTGSP